MENLNAEQIKKALECCGASDKSCSSCPLAKDYSPCSRTMADNALALIKSQEQKIEAYRQELAEVRVALVEANCDKKRLTEEAEGIKQCMEHEHASFMETFGEYGEKCDKLTEENDKLRASCTELARVQAVLKMGEWISVEERLPDPAEYDWVLVNIMFNEDGSYGVPDVAEYRKGEWWNFDNKLSDLGITVTHWQPLPPPPEAE